ncbi:MAG: cytochrome bd-I oxidase subunit CydX [Methylococcales bacterium]
MWYFAWILGVLLACAFGIINVLWLEAQENLKQDSMVLDPLTKTLTRFEFLTILRERISHTIFEPIPFCVLMMGLNDASRKAINTRREQGERLILEYVSVIRGVLPRRNAITARYDSSTFAAILSETDVRTAQSFAEKICAFSKTHAQASPSEGVTISIGISACGRDLLKECGNDPDLAFNTLLRNADQAMQEAREQGGDRHVTVIAPSRLAT